MTTVGLLSPGSMGAAVGGRLVAAGSTVLWASEGRSDATRARADAFHLDAVADLHALCEAADVVLSICPPHAARETAERVSDCGFTGIYVDANAISPATARMIAGIVEPAARYVDGGIIGGPPKDGGSTRLYLAGRDAAAVSALFDGLCDGGSLEAPVLDGDVPAASALKLAFAAYTKGSSALLLAVRAFADAEGVADDLLAEWSRSLPDLADRSEKIAPGVSSKAWRWIGEMEQIAEAFGDAELPGDIHRGFADIFRRLEGRKDTQDTTLDEVIADLLAAE